MAVILSGSGGCIYVSKCPSIDSIFRQGVQVGIVITYIDVQCRLRSELLTWYDSFFTKYFFNFEHSNL